MFQVQSVIGSSIPLLSHLEASTPKCFRQSRSNQTRQHGDAMSSMDIGLHFFRCFHVPSICRVPCRKFVQKVISHPPPPPPPPLLSISEHVQHVSNRRSATCQKQQPLQGRRISRMPKESLGYLPFAGQTNIMRKCNNVGSRLVWGSTIVSPGSKIIPDLWEWLGATLIMFPGFWDLF